MLRLRWEWLEEDELGWWLKVPPRGAPKVPRGIWLSMNRHALRALELVRDRAAPEACGIIYPWPHTTGCLQDWMQRILEASRIPPNRRFKFHGLRKAFANELGKINGLIVPMALGHAKSDVTLDSYVHRQMLVDAVSK